MYIRKIAAAAGLACGVGLGFAPLASADPIDFTSVFDSEIAQLNSVFDFGAQFSGVPSDALYTNEAGFSAVFTEFAPVTDDPSELTPFSYFLYGVNPIAAGIADDPASYVVFNGALTEFYDAYNVGLYALFNGGDLIPLADADQFLFGTAANLADVLGEGATVSSAISDFLGLGFGDLAGYFDLGSLFSGAVG